MSITKDQFINELLDVKKVLLTYIKNPIQEIKVLPDWTWPKLIAVQAAFTAICGALAGLLEEKIVFSVIAGLISMPFITLITVAVSSLFFYYCFQIFADKTVSFRKMFTIVFFANIPHFIFQIASGFLPPVILVGLAFSAFLLVVGFVEHFQVQKRLVIRIIAALYAIFFVIWIVGRINSSRFENDWGSDIKMEAPEVELGK